MRALAALAIPLAIAYGGTWPWLWGSWNFREGYYAHAPLVVGLAVLLAWHGRAKLAEIARTVDPRGWWLLGPGLLLHLAGGALAIDSLSAVSLLLSVPGVVMLSQGSARLRLVLPLIGLLPFIMPMPIVVTGRVAFELKEIAVDSGLWISNALGAGATRSGAEIAIPDETERLVVADACSGLRSLVALMTLGYCLAFFLGAQRGARRWILLGLAGPIAIVTNALRIAAICLLARAQGVPFASTTGHDVATAIAWMIDIVLLLLADAALSRRRTR